jgi:yeast amino acid transporter
LECEDTERVSISFYPISLSLSALRIETAVEFVLAIIKIITCIGLIILGIIINVGGVPGDPTGYIGGKYWRDPGAFHNGFKGFCAVFTNAVRTQDLVRFLGP